MIAFIFAAILHAALMVLLMAVTDLHWFLCFVISGLVVWMGVVVIAWDLD